MILSQRTKIRYKVQELLKKPTPIKGIRDVQLNRQARIANEETPLIMVYTRSESAEIGVTAPREMERILKLVVEIAVYDKTVEPVDDLMDRVAYEVEKRLSRDETLGGLVSDCVLSDTELDFITESESEIGACRITFDVKYNTEASQDPAELDDFNQYGAEYTPPNATPDTVPVEDETNFV